MYAVFDVRVVEDGEAHGFVGVKAKVKALVDLVRSDVQVAAKPHGEVWHAGEAERLTSAIGIRIHSGAAKSRAEIRHIAFEIPTRLDITWIEDEVVRQIEGYVQGAWQCLWASIDVVIDGLAEGALGRHCCGRGPVRGPRHTEA